MDVSRIRRSPNLDQLMPTMGSCRMSRTRRFLENPNRSGSPLLSGPTQKGSTGGLSRTRRSALPQAPPVRIPKEVSTGISHPKSPGSQPPATPSGQVKFVLFLHLFPLSMDGCPARSKPAGRGRGGWVEACVGLGGGLDCPCGPRPIRAVFNRSRTRLRWLCCRDAYPYAPLEARRQQLRQAGKPPRLQENQRAPSRPTTGKPRHTDHG